MATLPGTAIATGPIGLNFSPIHSDCDLLNRIVAVAEPVPFREFGLNSACTIHCTHTEHGWPGNLDARHVVFPISYQQQFRIRSVITY